MPEAGVVDEDVRCGVLTVEPSVHGGLIINIEGRGAGGQTGIGQFFDAVGQSFRVTAVDDHVSTGFRHRLGDLPS